MAYPGAFLLLASALIILWRAGLPQAPDFSPDIAPPIPAFEANLLNGETVTISAPTGTPLIINFWATWCVPCVDEMPMLEAVYQSGIPVLGVNAGQEDQATVESWLVAQQITLPVMIDEGRSVEALWQVRGLPTTFFVDANGRLQKVVRGELTPDSLAEGIALMTAQQETGGRLPDAPRESG